MRKPGPALDGLREFVETLPPGCSVLEVGSYAGESASVFATRAAHVWCVDPWLPYADELDHGPQGCPDLKAAEHTFDAVARRSHGTIVKIRAPSLVAANIIAPFSMDCVYLDGPHGEGDTIQQIYAWVKKVRPGGVLAGHDYVAPEFATVIRAVDSCFGKPDHVYQDSTWVVKGAENGPLQRLLPGPKRRLPLPGPPLVAPRTGLYVTGTDMPTRTDLPEIRTL